MIPEDHPENVNDIELSFSDEEFDFNKFIKDSDHLLGEKIDEAATETVVSLINEIVKQDIPGEIESYAKVSAQVVIKLKILIRMMFADDEVSESFVSEVISLIKKDKN